MRVCVCVCVVVVVAAPSPCNHLRFRRRCRPWGTAARGGAGCCAAARLWLLLRGRCGGLPPFRSRASFRLRALRCHARAPSKADWPRRRPRSGAAGQRRSALARRVSAQPPGSQQSARRWRVFRTCCAPLWPPPRALKAWRERKRDCFGRPAGGLAARVLAIGRAAAGIGGCGWWWWHWRRWRRRLLLRRRAQGAGRGSGWSSSVGSSVCDGC